MVFRLPYFIHSLPEFNLPYKGAYTRLTPPGPYRVTTYRERELTLDHIYTFLTTQGYGGFLRMRNQFNVRATSETTRTCKIILFTGPFILARWLWKDDYDGQMIFGNLVGLKLLKGEQKPPKKPQPGNLSRPEIEPGPAAWQVRMLPPAPQRWTRLPSFIDIKIKFTVRDATAPNNQVVIAAKWQCTGHCG